MLVLPLGEQPLDLRGMHGGVEARVRSKRRILGERERVRRPGTVRRGRREPDDLPDTDGGCRVEHPPRPFDVDARHERPVGDRIDDRGEVHEDLDPFEQGLEIVAGDVHPVQLELRDAPGRFAHVEADDPVDVRFRGERGHQTLPEEAGDTGDRDGFVSHESP